MFVHRIICDQIAQ